MPCACKPSCSPIGAGRVWSVWRWLCGASCAGPRRWAPADAAPGPGARPGAVTCRPPLAWPSGAGWCARLWRSACWSSQRLRLRPAHCSSSLLTSPASSRTGRRCAWLAGRWRPSKKCGGIRVERVSKMPSGPAVPSRSRSRRRMGRSSPVSWPEWALWSPGWRRRGWPRRRWRMGCGTLRAERRGASFRCMCRRRRTPMRLMPPSGPASPLRN